MNEVGKASLLEVASLFQQYISTPIKTSAGIGSQFRHSAVGPWILIEPVSRDRENQFQARTEAINLLEDFYTSHKSEPFGARLILRRIGVFGGFLIAAQDSDILELLPNETREEQTSKHLAEFKNVGEYISQSANSRKKSPPSPAGNS